MQIGNEILSDSAAAGITWYKFVKRMYPNSSRAAYNLGYAHENLNDNETALAYYRESLELVETDENLFSSAREFILREARKKILELENDY